MGKWYFHRVSRDCTKKGKRITILLPLEELDSFGPILCFIETLKRYLNWRLLKDQAIKFFQMEMRKQMIREKKMAYWCWVEPGSWPKSGFLRLPVAELPCYLFFIELLYDFLRVWGRVPNIYFVFVMYRTLYHLLHIHWSYWHYTFNLSIYHSTCSQSFVILHVWIIAKVQ